MRHRYSLSPTRVAWIFCTLGLFPFLGVFTVSAPHVRPCNGHGPKLQSSPLILQVCSSSPLILLARATSSGLVELLALDTPVRPSAASSAPRVAARVLEEIEAMSRSGELLAKRGDGLCCSCCCVVFEWICSCLKEAHPPSLAIPEMWRFWANPRSNPGDSRSKHPPHLGRFKNHTLPHLGSSQETDLTICVLYVCTCWTSERERE